MPDGPQNTPVADPDPVANPFEQAEADADARALRRGVVQVALGAFEYGGRWRELSRCGNVDSEDFHPISAKGEGELAISRAQQNACDVCPVHAACRELRNDLGATGVWGGVYYPDPVTTRPRGCALKGCKRAARPTRRFCSDEHHHDATVGTPAGYHLHVRLEQRPCHACRDAYRVDNLARNAKLRTAKKERANA